MAIDVTTPGGLMGGSPNFMGVTYNPSRVGTTNVVNEAQNIIGDPAAFASSINATVSGNVPQIDANAVGTNLNNVNYGPTDQFNMNTAIAETSANTSVSMPNSQTGYNPASINTAMNMSGFNVDTAQGEITSNELVDPNTVQIDMEAAANNAAYNDFAHQDISMVIDTSTIAGKMVADDLGRFNYTDSKQTVQGQLELLSKQFVDPNTGEYKIPAWAAGIANSVKGMLNIKTGDMGAAFTAKISQALLEASLPIAQADAQIFNGIAMKNLDNKQQMTLNKALVLSKFEAANLDAKLTAVVNNSKNFMQMKIANLTNEQQSNVLDAQLRFQALFEDAKEENLAARFDITNQLDRDKWFTTLSANVGMFHDEQANAMARFNAGELNAGERFNAELEKAMFVFEKEHNFQIDQSNAKWRQAVTMQNTQNSFEAALQDAKTILSLNSEAMNHLWNRSDMQFNYLATSTENQKDRDLKMFQMKLEAQIAAMKAKAEQKGALFGAIGNVLGSVAGSMFGSGGMFGASAAAAGGTAAAAGGGGFLASLLGIFSDADLKTNVKRIGTHKSGLPLYKWDWNEKAIELGIDSGRNVGVMADEAKQKFPKAVTVHPNGYMMVNYERLQ